jgi:hypothetical protein
MSRAGRIIEWVIEVDEANGTPSAFIEDPDDQHDLNMAQGYHYQGRYDGDDPEDGMDSRELDGTKPSGMHAGNWHHKGERTNRVMSVRDKVRMDTALAQH